jgi:hypothetical protein
MKQYFIFLYFLDLIHHQVLILQEHVFNPKQIIIVSFEWLHNKISFWQVMKQKHHFDQNIHLKLPEVKEFLYHYKESKHDHFLIFRKWHKFLE